MSVKEQVLKAIQRLPDDIDFRDASDEIALLAAVEEAERDIKEGRLISDDEMKLRIAQWSARKSGPSDRPATSKRSSAT
jgi:hypothetical protein